MGVGFERIGCDAAAALRRGVEALGFGFDGSFAVALANPRRHCGRANATVRVGSTVRCARAHTESRWIWLNILKGLTKERVIGHGSFFKSDLALIGTSRRKLPIYRLPIGPTTATTSNMKRSFRGTLSTNE